MIFESADRAARSLRGLQVGTAYLPSVEPTRQGVKVTEMPHSNVHRVFEPVQSIDRTVHAERLYSG